MPLHIYSTIHATHDSRFDISVQFPGVKISCFSLKNPFARSCCVHHDSTVVFSLKYRTHESVFLL